MEAGLFYIMLGLGFGFMAWGFIRSASLFTSILRMLSISLFMGLALFIGSGQEVVATTTQTVNSQGIDPNGAIVALVSTSTSEDVIIPANEGAWLSWVFTGFGILNMVFVVKEAFSK